MTAIAGAQQMRGAVAETRKGRGTELGITPTPVALFLQLPLLEVSPRGPSLALCFWVPRHKGSK